MWHRDVKFCPLCGALLVLAEVEGRRRSRCPSCRFVFYPNPASASAAVVLDEDRRVLLIRRRIEPFRGHWALPAGYQEIDEDPRDTAQREVSEETGILIQVVELFDVLFVSDDPRKPANVNVFLCRPVGGELRPGSDASHVEWFSLDALPSQLGFRNGPLILERLRTR